MGTRTSSFSPTISTDAAFQAWIGEVDASLLAFGWAHGADTGQLTLASATKPVGATTLAGFVIYKMGDSLQTGGAPCFLRIDYGSGTTASSAAMKVQIGTSTNGSGTLTGNVSTAVTTNANVAAGNNACFTSGTSSRFCMAFWPDVLANALTFTVERDRDGSGNETGVGIGIIVPGTSLSTGLQQFVPESGGVPASEAKLLAWQCSSSVTETGGNKTTISPIRQASGPLRNPSLSLLVVGVESMPLTVSTLSFYGTNHTYLSLYQTHPAANFIGGQLLKFMILWE